MERLRRFGRYVHEELTLYAPTRGVVFILSLSLMGWGFWVLNPWAVTFINPIYSIMTMWATEPAWGLAFIFTGANLLHGAIAKSAESVRRGAMLGWLLWLLVSVLYALAEPTATMVVTNFCLALMHGWVYLQAHLHPDLLTGEVTITDLEKFKRQQTIKEI